MEGIALAALRVSIGLVVLTLHGRHKVSDGWHYFANGTDWPLWHDTVQLGAPAPLVMAVVAALCQSLGAGLLAVGLGTRVAALAVAATMMTALAFNQRTGGPDGQLAGLYALATGTFVLAGGGRWSLDYHVIRHRQLGVPAFITAHADGITGGRANGD
ncbi:MAG: DoxX family protein [Vicinamibacterales bacterium]